MERLVEAYVRGPQDVALLDKTIQAILKSPRRASNSSSDAFPLRRAPSYPRVDTELRTRYLGVNDSR